MPNKQPESIKEYFIHPETFQAAASQDYFSRSERSSLIHVINISGVKTLLDKLDQIAHQIDSHEFADCYPSLSVALFEASSRILDAIQEARDAVQNATP